jgi:hypothetical protein
MKRCLLLLAMVACACPNKQTSGPAGTGGSSTGAGPGSGGDPAVLPTTGGSTCEDVKARVEQLYRAEAQVKEPQRVDEAVADNTAMVMTDCKKDPARFVPCLAKAPTVAELEKQCLLPLDEEGTEGERR